MKVTGNSDLKSAVAGPGGTGGPSAEGVGSRVGRLAGSAWARTTSTIRETRANVVATVLLIQTTISSKVAHASSSVKDSLSSAASNILRLGADTKASLHARACSAKAQASNAVSDALAATVSRIPAPVKDRAVQAAELSTAKLGKAVEAFQERRVAAVACIDACKVRVAEAMASAQAMALRYVPSPVKTAADSTSVFVTARVTAVRSGLSNAAGCAGAKASAAAEFAKSKASVLASETRAAVSNQKYQVTLASAVGGAATIGASGGATGVIAGGIAGVACGIPPALFTFGLSIPLGAMVGSGAGLVIGTSVGGIAGLVSGGAVGFTGYTKRDAITGGANCAWAKVSNCAEAVQAKASASTEYMKEKACTSTVYVKETALASKEYVRVRLVGGTGGTDTA